MNFGRWDRWVTGFALTVTGFIGTGLLHILTMEIKLPTATVRSGSPRLIIQDNTVELVPGQMSVICPVVLKDGSLDPGYSYPQPREDSWLEDYEANESRIASLHRWNRNLEWRKRDRFGRNYRMRLRQVELSRQPRSSWLVTPEIGLIRVSGEGRLEGSLTDEGWSPERRAATTFREAIDWLPNTVFYGGRSQVNESVTPWIVYLTSEGLYRADLALRNIARIAPVDGSVSALWQLGESEAQPLYLLTPNDIALVPTRPGDALKTWRLPPSLRDSDGYDIAAGSEGRIVVRAERKSATRKDRIAYQVAVLDRSLEVEKEYAYEFGPPGWTGSFERATAMVWAPQPRSELGGYFAAAVSPLAWRAATLLPEDFSRFCRTHLGFKVWFGAVWISIVISSLLAALVFRTTRPHFADWRGPLAWAGFVLLFGIAGFLTWMLLGGYERARPCAGCGRKSSSRFAACPRCGSSSPGPKMLGVEILRAPRVG